MDNDDNLLDDDLLDISLDDLSTEDLEEPAEEKPDEEVIELIDLVEKGDEDMMDLDETKPLFDEKVTSGDPDSEPDDKMDYNDSEETGETSDISRSDLTLGDVLLETGTSELGTDIKSGEDIDQDKSGDGGEEDLLNGSLAYMNADLEDSPDTEDISDELIDENGSEDSVPEEDIAFDESSDDLLNNDEVLLGESTGELNTGNDDSLEDEESADDNQQDTAEEELSVSDEMEEEEISATDDLSEDDAEDIEAIVSSALNIKSSESDFSDDTDEYGISIDLDSGFFGEESDSPNEDDDSLPEDSDESGEISDDQLTDHEDFSDDLSEGDEVQDEPVDEVIELPYTAVQDEVSPDEGDLEESEADSIFQSDDGTDITEEDKSDGIIDAPPEEFSDGSSEAGTVIVSEEKIEEIVNKVVGDVVEKVARQVFSEVAEKVITEAIEGLKKSLEADSE